MSPVISGFSAPSKHATLKLDSGKVLDVLTISFSDRIVVMAYLNGSVGVMVS